jgi:hypothetical protein
MYRYKEFSKSRFNSGGIVDHHCLIFPCFVDIGGIVDHHCLIFPCFVDIGGIVDHHCLIFPCFVDIGGIVSQTPPVFITSKTNSNCGNITEILLTLSLNVLNASFLTSK